MNFNLRPWIYPKWSYSGGTYGEVTIEDGKQVMRLEFVNGGKRAFDLTEHFFEYGASDVDDSAKIEEIARRKTPIPARRVIAPDELFNRVIPFEDGKPYLYFLIEYFYGKSRKTGEFGAVFKIEATNKITIIRSWIE